MQMSTESKIAIGVAVTMQRKSYIEHWLLAFKAKDDFCVRFWSRELQELHDAEVEFRKEAEN